MEKIFFASIALFLSASATALPLQIWEAGGQIRDVHIQDYSSTSPNTNAEKNVIYSNTSADNAGYINNFIRVTDPITANTYPTEMFRGSQGRAVDSGTSFQLGQLDFSDWGLFEGNEALDLSVIFNYFDTSTNSTQYKRVIFSLQADFDVSDDGSDRLVKFTPTSTANFSLNGDNYNLSFDSICKISSTTTCGAGQTWFSLADSKTKFGVYATLNEGSASEVPEPSSLSILFAGLIAFSAVRSRRIKRLED